MRHKKRGHGASLALVAAVVCVLCIALLVVASRVFVVRDIMVVGNRHLLREEIVTLSGVQVGDSSLGITDAQLKERLEKNRYIEYLGKEFDYQGRLTLKINERLGMAVINAFGRFYVLDASGMVLECTGSAYPDTVYGPKINGLHMAENTPVLVGETTPVRDRVQLAQMERLLTALDETSLLARGALVNLNNLDNLYCMTNDGAKIVLGTIDDVKTKLLIAREVLTLREPAGDLHGAKIDVSSGRQAHYIPAVLPTITPVPTVTPAPTPTPTP